MKVLRQKDYEKMRKFRDKQQKLSVAKLSFVGKYFKTQTNPRTETTPRLVDKLNHARLNSVIICPAAKRKGGGVEYMAEFFLGDLAESFREERKI